MIRRRLLLLAVIVLVALVLLGVGGWLVIVPETIRPGMTRAEVEAILGPPHGRMLEGDKLILVWRNRLVIEFDDVSCVREVSRPPSLLNNFLGLFGQ
jgi:hypothetical protein